MGGKLVLPEPDERIRKDIVIGRLTPYELSRFWRYFKRLDTDKTGFVHLDKLCKFMEYERNLVSDSVLDLLDIDYEHGMNKNMKGKISFAEFLDAVVTYCLFSRFEILKFCFYVFDQDKNGYYEPEQLKMLMNSLHGIKAGETVKGDLKKAWYNLEIAEDNRIEFEEFDRFERQFPQMFRPAFELQIKMIAAFNGEAWWEKKKRKLQEIKDAKRAKKQRKEDKKQKRREATRANKIMRQMGIVRYYLCPCFRIFYAPPVEELENEELTREQLKKKRQDEIKAAKRKADADAKNQETVEWKNFKKKTDPTVGGNIEIIEKAVMKTGRRRDDRVVARRDRKEKRAVNLDDGFDRKPKDIPPDF